MHPLKVFSFAERQTELQKHAHRHQSQNSGLDRLIFFVNLALLPLNVFNFRTGLISNVDNFTTDIAIMNHI